MKSCNDKLPPVSKKHGFYRIMHVGKFEQATSLDITLSYLQNPLSSGEKVHNFFNGNPLCNYTLALWYSTIMLMYTYIMDFH